MSAVETAFLPGGISMGQDTKAGGRVEALRSVLVKLLGNRFGSLSPAVAGRIDTAGIAELERWLDRGYEARSLDDVFGG